MSLASACLATLARTLVICLFAWPVCALIERWLRGLADSWRRVAVIGLLAPFCFPELLVGYAFRDLAMANPKWAELLTAVLLFVRVVPVGAVALLMAPPAECDAAAIHCQRMLLAKVSHDSQWFELVKCYWHGPVSLTLPALGLMALVSFQEFELAALLMTTSWTDWFIAAERVGLERMEMLRQSMWLLVIQLPLLIGLLTWIGRESARRRDDSFGECDDLVQSLWARVASWFVPAYLLMAVSLGCVVPMMLIGWRTVDGFVLLAKHRTQQLGLLQESSVSLAAAVCAGMTAWIASRWLMKSRSADNSCAEPSRHLVRTWNVWATWRLVLLPGLMGSLLLSLGAVGLFQLAWLRPLYDTPLPWLLALVVWLLPRAAVLQLWLNATRPGEAVYLAELAMSNERRAMKQNGDTRFLGIQRSWLRALLWRLRDQPAFLAISLLCYWAYCDLPTAYLLAPTGMAPGLVRLYNFMHFGRSAALSAEACLFFGGPLAVGLVVLAVRRGWR